jgi:L-amino acid N-acyltransferase
VNLIRCDSRWSDSILAIFNHAILNTTALYDYKPRTPEVMAVWFEGKAKGNFPVMGAVTDGGELMGFGTYGSFRPHAAYKYCVEHSVYVAAQFRGHGAGKLLLKRIIAEAREQNYHTLIGGIDSGNTVSIRLHESMGFAHCGTIRQAGYTFGRWLDLAFYQLLLETPANPVEG